MPLSASVCLPTCTLAVWTRARRVENFSLVSLTVPSPLNKTPNKIYCEYDCLIIYLPNHFFFTSNNLVDILRFLKELKMAILLRTSWGDLKKNKMLMKNVVVGAAYAFHFFFHPWLTRIGRKGFSCWEFFHRVGGEMRWGVKEKKKFVFQKARIQTAQRANTHTYTSCGACLFINARTYMYPGRPTGCRLVSRGGC